MIDLQLYSGGVRSGERAIMLVNAFVNGDVRFYRGKPQREKRCLER